MAQFGSGRSIIAQNQSAVTDPNGNLIVSPDNGFGGSPLGVAARTQALYGIPNANFDVLPSDPYSAITVSNPLPYWDTAINGLGTATMVYTDATQSWAVRLNPTEGTASGETITLKARTYLLNDSNLTLRQKAFASIAKVGTQATSEWNLVLSATYFDEAGTQLSTYNIGTANSGSAWTTINGFTTSGTAAIDPAAHYADLALTLTTSGSVAGTAMVDINSLLIQTSTGAAGAQSFLLTETFLASGDFVVPTGVDYVTVVAVGAGQGGGGGGNSIGRSAGAQTAGGGAGGATGYYALARDIFVGNVGTVTVGIGAGGTGGTAFAFNKPAGTTQTQTNNASTGSNGGNTTFGTYFTVAGARTAPSGFFGIASAAGASGGAVGGNDGGAGGIGGTHIIGSTNTGAPFINFWAGGVAGGTATGSGGTGANGNGGIAGTALAIAGGGGGGGGGSANATGAANAAGAGGVGGPGGGASGGGASARYATATATIVATAGAGATAAANTGAGGGGGGACAVSFTGTATYNPSTLTTTSGAGGAGGSGVLYVIYVG